MIEIFFIALLTVAVISSWNSGYKKGVNKKISEDILSSSRTEIYSEMYKRGVQDGATGCLELLIEIGSIDCDYLVKLENNKLIMYRYENEK